MRLARFVAFADASGGWGNRGVHARPLAPEENGDARERQWASVFRARFGCLASIGVRERPWALIV
jgi:hypothetical protein